MSPAGHWPQLHAAIEAGADSVYFGLTNFTARAKVGFTLDELPSAIRTLHQRGVKGFVTFNTLIFEDELPEAARTIAAIADSGADAIIVQAPDPRLPKAGIRMLSSHPLVTNATPDDWHVHRLALGLPDGTRDLEAEKTVLLEAGFDELSGVSWTKGCYMGQELTARTKYRGLVKRRLFPVQIDGPPPERGAVIMQNDREVGTMRSSTNHAGLALLRLDSLDGPLTCEQAKLTPTTPDWMNRTL